MKAIHYAALVGKYVRIERDVEAEDGVPEGMECTVLLVRDMSDGGVMIMADYGHAFVIPDDSTADEWKFSVWPNEALAKELRAINSDAP